MSKYDAERLFYLLYRSLDGELTPDEKHELSEGLKENPEFETEKERLLKMRQMLANKSVNKFTSGFADRVVGRIRKIKSEEESLFDSIIWSFRRVALIGTATILILAFNNIITGNGLSVDSLLALPEISLENTLASNSLFLGE